jgi:hypothetical protein
MLFYTVVSTAEIERRSRVLSVKSSVQFNNWRSVTQILVSCYLKTSLGRFKTYLLSICHSQPFYHPGLIDLKTIIVLLTASNYIWDQDRGSNMSVDKVA